MRVLILRRVLPVLVLLLLTANSPLFAASPDAKITARKHSLDKVTMTPRRYLALFTPAFVASLTVFHMRLPSSDKLDGLVHTYPIFVAYAMAYALYQGTVSAMAVYFVMINIALPVAVNGLIISLLPIFRKHRYKFPEDLQAHLYDVESTVKYLDMLDYVSAYGPNRRTEMLLAVAPKIPEIIMRLQPIFKQMSYLERLFRFRSGLVSLERWLSEDNSHASITSALTNLRKFNKEVYMVCLLDPRKSKSDADYIIRLIEEITVVIKEQAKSFTGDEKFPKNFEDAVFTMLEQISPQITFRDATHVLEALSDLEDNLTSFPDKIKGKITSLKIHFKETDGSFYFGNVPNADMIKKTISRAGPLNSDPEVEPLKTILRSFNSHIALLQDAAGDSSQLLVTLSDALNTYELQGVPALEKARNDEVDKMRLYCKLLDDPEALKNSKDFTELAAAFAYVEMRRIKVAAVGGADLQKIQNIGRSILATCKSLFEYDSIFTFTGAEKIKKYNECETAFSYFYEFNNVMSEDYGISDAKDKRFFGDLFKIQNDKIFLFRGIYFDFKEVNAMENFVGLYDLDISDKESMKELLIRHLASYGTDYQFKAESSDKILNEWESAVAGRHDLEEIVSAIKLYMQVLKQTFDSSKSLDYISLFGILADQVLPFVKKAYIIRKGFSSLEQHAINVANTKNKLEADKMKNTLSKLFNYSGSDLGGDSKTALYFQKLHDALSWPQEAEYRLKYGTVVKAIFEAIKMLEVYFNGVDIAALGPDYQRKLDVFFKIVNDRVDYLTNFVERPKFNLKHAENLEYTFSIIEHFSAKTCIFESYFSNKCGGLSELIKTRCDYFYTVPQNNSIYFDDLLDCVEAMKLLRKIPGANLLTENSKDKLAQFFKDVAVALNNKVKRYVMKQTLDSSEALWSVITVGDTENIFKICAEIDSSVRLMDLVEIPDRDETVRANIKVAYKDIGSAKDWRSGFCVGVERFYRIYKAMEPFLITASDKKAMTDTAVVVLETLDNLLIERINSKDKDVVYLNDLPEFYNIMALFPDLPKGDYFPNAKKVKIAYEKETLAVQVPFDLEKAYSALLEFPVEPGADKLLAEAMLKDMNVKIHNILSDDDIKAKISALNAFRAAKLRPKLFEHCPDITIVFSTVGTTCQNALVILGKIDELDERIAKSDQEIKIAQSKAPDTVPALTLANTTLNTQRKASVQELEKLKDSLNH